MNGSRISLLALALTLVGSAVAAAEGDFTARGNEPGWILQMNKDGLTFQPMDGAPTTISPLPAAVTIDGVETYRSTLDGQPFTLAIAQKLCVDSMSGMPYPASVGLAVGEREFQGCGGEPETLLHGEWTVTQIDGKPIVSGSEATLTFEPGGHLNGGASCNRYFSGYTLTGEGLAIGPVGATRMMCEQSLMNQEGLFLAILEGVTRFEIGPDGSLILHGSDGRSLTASHK